MNIQGKFVQLADYTEYVMEVAPVKAKTAIGGDITSDLAVGFHYPEKIEEMREKFAEGLGLDITFVEDTSYRIESGEERRTGLFTGDGVSVELSTVFNMMAAGFNSVVGTHFSTYAFQVGVSAGGKWGASEPNNNNFNPFDWSPAQNPNSTESSSLTFPRPNTALDFKAKWAVIGVILKDQGWVKDPSPVK